MSGGAIADQPWGFSNPDLDKEIVRIDAKPLATFSASDLQKMEFPPIQYVVPGYVVEGLTLMAGKPKIGNSWLVLDWALAVAYGGIACGSIQCESGEVLYCALEDNQRRLRRRLHQLLPDSDWPARLELITSLKRLDQGGLDDVKRWVGKAERPRLVVLDTFACVKPPRTTKDSAYDADYAALGPLQQLASDLNIAIVAVHHVRKLESDDPLDTVSGTTGLTGAVDTVLVLNRDSQGTTLYGRGRDVEGFRRNGRVLVCARCDSDEPEHATLAIDAIDKHTPVGKIRTALLVAYERERKAKAAA